MNLADWFVAAHKSIVHRTIVQCNMFFAALPHFSEILRKPLIYYVIYIATRRIRA